MTRNVCIQSIICLKGHTHNYVNKRVVYLKWFIVCTHIHNFVLAVKIYQMQTMGTVWNLKYQAMADYQCHNWLVLKTFHFLYDKYVWHQWNIMCVFDYCKLPWRCYKPASLILLGIGLQQPCYRNISLDPLWLKNY